MRKGLWSPDEDEKLRTCIAQHRSGSWSDIARKAGLQRCGKSCRRRWMNHLRPDLKREKFTPEELKLVAKLHQTMGNKWSEIATYLVGRTDNDVKNLWNTQIKKQLLQVGHHEPILESKGNEVQGLPFPKGSNIDHTGRLSFTKPQSARNTLFPTNTCLIVDSCGSSSIISLEVEPHIQPQGVIKMEHDVMNKPFDPCLTSSSRKETHTQMHVFSKHTKVAEEERLGCILDECHLMESIDACARSIGDTSEIYPCGGVHDTFYNVGGDHSSLFTEGIVMKQQSDSNMSSSYSSREGVGSSNESSTATCNIRDDTCSVGKPSFFELHHQLYSQDGDDNDYYEQVQKGDVDDVNCLSRRESWSSSPCEQWALETLIGTCDGYSKVPWY